MVCFLISLMPKIVGTKLHVNTYSKEFSWGRRARGQDRSATKFPGLIGINLDSTAILIFDLSFDGDLLILNNAK